ncbi:MAG TPA: NAD(P)H-dependent glycerol-3-phosphate dehydrogenase [Mesorhizobium sp.]|jgi:glycerol-3-phosphate dehydrogenase (NAD(P)+)|nr:NAD(P)H-dependent glycerol-3-phosphate dehydrogenase [Mesorhizobium sp.]
MRAAAILGGGAWGTALAQALSRAGIEARLWARDAETVRAIREQRENPNHLPGVTLHPSVSATGDLGEALGGAEAALIAVPAQALRGVLPQLAPHLPPRLPLVLCAKGIEGSTGLLLSEVVQEELPGARIAALSGPSFAADVGRGFPTAVVVAARDAALAQDLAKTFSSESFRCYSTDDLSGVEAGGALKNVLAIASGAVSGAGLGASAGAAMVTRGFVELRRLAVVLGGRPETVMGLSGLGDLLLTASSAQSRNFSYGLALGRGESLENRPLAEGVATASIAAKIAQERGIDAPIVGAVAAILAQELTVRDAVAQLMSRPLKSEDA